MLLIVKLIQISSYKQEYHIFIPILQGLRVAQATVTEHWP